MDPFYEMDQEFHSDTALAEIPVGRRKVLTRPVALHTRLGREELGPLGYEGSTLIGDHSNAF